MFQRLVNLLYRHPKAELKKFSRFGGYSNYRKMMSANELMKPASFNLGPVQSYTNGLPVYFLTGEKYLYQTLFCIQSLVKYSDNKFRFILVDDGSFNEELAERVKKQLPGAVLIASSAIDYNLLNTLPADKFPCLHQKRKVYPHIRKLTDVHTIPGNQWKLVLDSDMLFWNEPAELIQWLKDPGKPLHMVDSDNSYGYSKQLMERLCNCSIRPLINVGAIGLNSAEIDWVKVESWVKELEDKEGKTYYLEQALSAMLIGDSSSIVLDADKYIVNPDKNSRGTLLHYVDLSKETYFTKAWRHFV